MDLSTLARIVLDGAAVELSQEEDDELVREIRSALDAEVIRRVQGLPIPARTCDCQPVFELEMEEEAASHA